ncbi:hypothetical protein ABMA10_03730 [Plantibacter sp. RU18]
MDHRPGILVLVTTHDLTGPDVDVVQPVDAAAHQNRVNGRRGHAQLPADPDRTKAFAPPQRHDLLHHRLAGAVRGAMRARGPILHALDPHRRVSVGPPLRGRPRNMEVHGRVTHRPTLINAQTRDAQSLAWRQSSINVGHRGPPRSERNLSSSTPTQEVLFISQRLQRVVTTQPTSPSSTARGALASGRVTPRRDSESLNGASDRGKISDGETIAVARHPAPRVDQMDRMRRRQQLLSLIGSQLGVRAT